MKTIGVYYLLLIAFLAINTLNAQNPWKSDALTLNYPMGIQSIDEKVFVYDITKSAGPDRYKLWIKENGSSEWVSYHMPHLTTAFYFLDKLNGWALADTALRPPRIWYTNDGGENWTAGFQFIKDFNVPFTSNNLQLFDNGIGYFGTQGFLFRTRDGGISFDTIYDSNEIFDVIGFTNSQVGWVGYSYADKGLEKTTDGGRNWIQQYPEINSISTIHTKSGQPVFVGGENAIAYSIDGGANWITKTVPIESPYRFVTKIQYTLPVIWIKYANKIWSSNVDNNDWKIALNPNSTKSGMADEIEIIDFSMKDENTGWALTNKGLMVYDLTSGVEEDQKSRFRFELAPNPFNEYTTIKFRVVKRSSVSLKVFNILGREIKTLIHDVLAPGEYTKVLSSVDLPEGIYFIKLTSDELSYSKKILLLR